MATKEIFDLSDIEQSLSFDNSMRDYEYFEFFPTNISNLNTSGNKDIVIQQQDLFTHPAESYLYLKGELTKSDGTAVTNPGNGEVSLINNAMMYLFERISYLINETVVEEIERPGQTTSMLGLLKYSPNQSSTLGVNMCWLPDLDYNTDKTNANMKLRSSLNKFSFMVPFKHIFGFMEDYNKVLYGVQQSFRLKRIIDDDAIQVKNGVNKSDFKVSLSKLSVLMPIVKPSLQTELKLLKAIDNKSVVDIIYRNRNTESTFLPANSKNFDWHLQTAAGIPRYIVISFQKNNVNSKSNFSNVNLKRLYVELNSKRYPDTDVEVDFSENDYSKIFTQTCNFKKRFYDSDEAPSFSPFTFKSLYPIFIIDVSKHEDRTKMSNLDIKIKASFDSAPGSNVEAFATLISDYEMKLESTGKRFIILK